MKRVLQVVCVIVSSSSGVFAVGFGGIGQGTHVRFVFCPFALQLVFPTFSCVQVRPLVQVKQLIFAAASPDVWQNGPVWCASIGISSL